MIVILITFKFVIFKFRVVDPDPDWIRIQSGLWIRIRILNPDPDSGGQK
jgi:hypothetical protein